MIFNEVIGNINEIDDLNEYHVETIYLNSEDVLIIKPSSITEMGVIAHALGNRHLQAQFEDDKMIIQYDRLVEEELKRDNVNYSRENITLKKAFKHVEFAHTH